MPSTKQNGSCQACCGKHWVERAVGDGKHWKMEIIMSLDHRLTFFLIGSNSLSICTLCPRRGHSESNNMRSGVFAKSPVIAVPIFWRLFLFVYMPFCSGSSLTIFSISH